MSVNVQTRQQMMLTSKEPIFRNQKEAFERWAEQGAQPNPKMVEKIGVKWQIPVNKTNSKGETILMHSCYHGNALTVEYLLSQGADPRAADKSGMTALHSCVMNQVIYIPIILMLLDPTKTKYPADVDAKSPSGHTPLQMASAIGNLSLVKALISRRANIAEKSKDGTAKEIAQRHGHGHIVQHIAQIEAQFPMQILKKKPQSESGGKVRRRWSFSQRAAGGDPVDATQKAMAEGLKDLAKGPDPIPEQKEPEPKKEEPEEDEDMPPISEEDREAFVFKDGYHLQYDSKRGKLALADFGSVKSAFDQMDWKKKDGKLTVHEFKMYFGRQGLKESRCKRLFRLFDRNGDRRITFKEFNARIQELLEAEIPRSPQAGSPRAARQKSGHGW